MNYRAKQEARRPTHQSDGTVYDFVSKATLDVVLIEDEPLYAQIILHRLEKSHLIKCNSHSFSCLAEVLTFLDKPDQETNVILLDLNLPDSQGLDTLDQILTVCPTLPVLVLTGMNDDVLAVKALESGAQDFLVKGRDDATVDRAILYAVERAHTQQILRESRESLRKAQLQLIQADKMETLGRLAAGVAHEVKNPLAILKMGLEYFRSQKTMMLNPNAKEITRDMETAVSRAQSILAGMLDFSIPTELSRENQQLEDILYRSVHMVQHELDNRSITVIFDVETPLPQVWVDPHKLQQVFINIIMNSAQAIQFDGSLEIRASTQTLDRSGDGVGRRESDPLPLGTKIITVEILDDGPGIPSRSLKKLFDPFFTSKPVGEGTGLGLAIVRNILELHGGRIDVMNRTDNPGACAKITLVA